MSCLRFSFKEKVIYRVYFLVFLFYVLSNSVALIHQKTQERIICLEDIPSCFADKDKMDQSVHITDC